MYSKRFLLEFERIYENRDWTLKQEFTLIFSDGGNEENTAYLSGANHASERKTRD